MGILGGIIGGIGKAAEGIGNAINKNVKTVKGDVAEKDTQLHEEQLAILAQFQAEFAVRQSRTWLDSLVDALNRLPRPLLTFGVIALFIWPAYQPGSYVDFLAAIQLIPDELWTLFIVIISFWFSSRLLSEDLLRKPKLTEEQKHQAIDIIKSRADALERERERVAQEAEDKAKQDVVVVIPPPEPHVQPDKLPDLPEDRASSTAINLMIESILQKEGGYSDLKADKGGPTNHGITLATLADWRGVPVTKEDVKALTRDEAIKIYRKNYYILPGIDTLPQGLQAHVLDCAVNSGPRAAVKLLQRVLNRYGESLVIDGIIGNATRDACRKYDTDKLNNALVDARLRFYESLVENDPSQRIFLAGWTKRAKSFSV